MKDQYQLAIIFWFPIVLILSVGVTLLMHGTITIDNYIVYVVIFLFSVLSFIFFASKKKANPHKYAFIGVFFGIFIIALLIALAIWFLSNYGV